MAGFSDFRLKPNERWIVRDGHNLEKIPLNSKGPFGRLTDWTSGASRLSSILTVVAKKTDKIDVNNRKEVEALVNLRKSVELCYGRSGRLAVWVDRLLHHGSTAAKKEKVITAIYEKLRSHFFGVDQANIVEKVGDWKKTERRALDTVYTILSSLNPTEKDLEKLEDAISFLQPTLSERKIWYTEMANLGYATAAYRLAQYYETGLAGKALANAEYALKSYEDAAQRGSIPAMIHLEHSYRKGNENLGIARNDQHAHHWAVRASSKSNAAALSVALDLIKGLGIEKNAELAQTKLLALIDSGTPLYQSKAAYYASENTDESAARELLQDALKGLGITIDDDADITRARYELGRYLFKAGDTELSTLLYTKTIKTGIEAVKRGDVEAAECLIEIDRDEPHLVATVPEQMKTAYRELGLGALLGSEASLAQARKLSPAKAKATLEWMADKYQGAPIGADLAATITDFTPEAVRQAFDELDEDQQARIKHLITISYALHPEGTITEHDHQLLAGALFGPVHASESLISIARILTDF